MPGEGGDLYQGTEMTPTTIEQATFYVVMNSDGKFFRAKGYGGRGDTWVKELQNAKVYTRVQPARACVTWFANHHPKFPPPRLVRFVVGSVEVVDERDRLAKVQAAKAKAESRYKIRELQRRKKEIEAEQKRLEEELKEMGSEG